MWRASFSLSLLPVLLFWTATALAVEAPATVRGAVRWQGTVALPGVVTVAPGAELTIAAGTEVRPQTAAAKLLVKGVLRVEGSAGAPVTFAAPAGWQGIELAEAAPGSRLEYAVFSRAATALSSIATGFTLRHCTFRDGETAIKLLREATPLIEDNLFAGNRIGIDSEMKSTATIRRNRFVGQKNTAILLSHSSVGAITGNVFEKNKQGIGVLQKYPDRISGNRFADNDTGIYCNQTQSTPHISGNTFEQNRVGLENLSFASPLVENNTFRGNDIAIRNDQFGAPRVVHNLFRANRTALYNYRKSNPVVEKNRIETSGVAIFCDYSSYPEVHQNNFRQNAMGVKLGIYQSGDWERQFGSQAGARQAARMHNRPRPQIDRPVAKIADVIDVSNNWWGADTAKLKKAGPEGNLAMFYDRRDQARVRYEGFDAQGYVFDQIRFAPWLTAPVADGGPQKSTPNPN